MYIINNVKFHLSHVYCVHTLVFVVFNLEIRRTRRRLVVVRKHATDERSYLT